MRLIIFIQFLCSDGVVEYEKQVSMTTCEVLPAFIQKKPNSCCEDFELDFTNFEKRTVKIFIDELYGCSTEDLGTEDLLKLLRLVDQHGSNKERDLIY